MLQRLRTAEDAAVALPSGWLLEWFESARSFGCGGFLLLNRVVSDSDEAERQPREEAPTPEKPPEPKP